ncbi:MAG: SO_0444 family Cu/Zn efflux transporter [Candidatus Cloacimonetes bacterium]|nr:SO_0444 family Cu/Zn efflux transporter [Candidatus Cloacimonadota bacterium]MCF7814679.1 SO_0444 family Cu/Zn efflux transporter [Candidatus Cloacimonadota bacterium]MCF7868241.1 SO_0444 family Cu/Zn efflux transporter [Candidatus Cloacimonadota bacterium]MCF7883674.1 SO_0444 family Cu/Zn efflux transporter [Candidatus Cloacimonadota bacterium]
MILNLLNEIFRTYLEIAPYLFIGLFFAGLLHVVFKKDFVAKHLGENDFLATIKASILGVPLPLCSCGVIPTALYLRRQNASKGSTLSFLISTPQTGVDSIIATYGMMGPVFAIFRPLAAFVMGITGGALTNILTRNDEDKIVEPKNVCTDCATDKPEPKSFWKKIMSGFNYAFKDFLDDIAIQLIVGVILAGVISFAIPDNFFEQFGGNGIVGMLIMIAFGIPLYVCATASIPIAVSLMLKGISPGAAFVFLVVGPATNAATIALIGNALGKKMVAIYLSVISVFAIGFGFLLNWIFDIFGNIENFNMMHHEHGIPWYLTVLMVLFSIFLLASLFRKIFPRKKLKIPKLEVNVNKQTFKIEGMTCNHCVMNVKNAIESVESVEIVEVSLPGKNAVVEGNFDAAKVKEAIEKAGYKVV